MVGRYAVVGHYCPTDATPHVDSDGGPASDGKIDDKISVTLLETLDGAEHALLWYPDGVIVDRIKQPG